MFDPVDLLHRHDTLNYSEQLNHFGLYPYIHARLIRLIKGRI